MSAVELLEKLKVLPTPEQSAFAELFHQWETQHGGNGAESAPKPFRMPDYAGRLKAMFPNGPIPGEPQAFWDELRAERF